MQEKNVDLFFSTMIEAAIKDDRALMEFPFFSLQKQPQMEPLAYNDGRAHIRITPGSKGIANIWDKDVLIYCATHVNDAIERGLAVDRKIRCSTYDVLRTTGRGVGKKDYEQLYDALFRLRNTGIETDIEADGVKERRGFGWIDSYRVIEREVNGRKVAVGLEITLNEWMFRALVKERRVLTINRDYFDLSMGLERRLYELARKHCGAQKEWKIGLERLAEKCGTRNSLKRFKYDLKVVIGRDKIPDYVFFMANDHNGEAAKVAAELGAKYPKGGRRAKNELIVVLVQPRLQAALAPLRS